MLHSIEDIKHVFHDDVDMAFMETYSVALAWEYHILFEELKADTRLPDDLKNLEFAARRSNCAARAAGIAAKEHNVPLLFWRLNSNGQQKFLIKMGRVLLIPEAISELFGRPKASNYKIALANTYGVTRQLELDLRDRPYRVTDWSGEVLGVLLHGAAGPSFSRRDKVLGNLMMAVPDDHYENWIARFDLHQLAMFGAKALQPEHEIAPKQRDDVFVTRKRKTSVIGIVK